MSQFKFYINIRSAKGVPSSRILLTKLSFEFEPLQIRPPTPKSPPLLKTHLHKFIFITCHYFYSHCNSTSDNLHRLSNLQILQVFDFKCH